MSNKCTVRHFYIIFIILCITGIALLREDVIADSTEIVEEETPKSSNEWNSPFLVQGYKKLMSLMEKEGKGIDYTQKYSRSELRDKLKKLLGLSLLLNKKDMRSLKVTTVEIKSKKKFIEKKLLFEDNLVGAFSALLLIPNPLPGQKCAAIIGLHGHGEDSEAIKKYLGLDLVNYGYVVILPTFRAVNIDNEEMSLSGFLLIRGLTLMGVRVYETQLVFDYLSHMEIVDDSRMGIIGHSGGASVANYFSAINEDVKVIITDAFCNPLDPTEPFHCETALLGIEDIIFDMKGTIDFLVHPRPHLYYAFPDNKKVLDFFERFLLKD